MLKFADATAGLPLGDQFGKLFEEEQVAIVRRLIERLVVQLEAEGRDPDEYERQHLGLAIMCIDAGIWRSAPTHAELACRPPSERLPMLGGGFLVVPEGKTLRELLDESSGTSRTAGSNEQGSES
jgi:hypothetical protein